MEDLKKELKRCPFCGHKAKIITGRWKNDYGANVFNAYVLCMTCEAKIKAYEADEEDKDEQKEAINYAVDAWNTRWKNYGE